MYFTYVVRPGELPLGRSPQCRPFWDSLMSMNMRLGTTLQLLSFLIILGLGVLSGTGAGYIRNTSYDVFNTVGTTGIAIFAGLCGLCGSILLNGFRNLGDDEASVKYTRGYRVGVKCLSVASMLDILYYTVYTVCTLSSIKYYEDSWEMMHTGSNPMVTFCAFSKIMKFAALIVYAGAYFFMEAYHNIGTAELWGWSISFLLKLAGLSMFLTLVWNSAFFDTIFTLFYGLGLGAIFIWSQSFEPLVVNHEVSLDQSALRNEWFKSKHAMSYYGPPIEDGTDFLKQ